MTTLETLGSLMQVTKFGNGWDLLGLTTLAMLRVLLLVVIALSSLLVLTKTLKELLESLS